MRHNERKTDMCRARQPFTPPQGSSRASSRRRRPCPFVALSAAAICIGASLPAMLHALSLERSRAAGAAAPTPNSNKNPDFAPVQPYRPSSVLPLVQANGETTPTDFDLGVGKALDTLRSDYPGLLVSHPDYSIYRKDISVIDPSGVHIHGLTAYKNAFRLLHAVVKVVYCAERSSLDFRMCYDKARQNIRVHWNAHVVPREIFGGVRTALHVDGISVYELDLVGNITQHRIEKLLINDMPVHPEEGIIAALQDRHQGLAIPSYFRPAGGPYQIERSHVVEFRPTFASFSSRPPSSSLFAVEGAEGAAPVSSSSSVAASVPQPLALSTSSTTSGSTLSAAADGKDGDHVGVDWDKFEKKNKSRKKFGLKPLSVEEFLEIEQKVAVLDAEQRQRMEAAAASMSNREKKEPNLFEKLFGKALADTCESNFDCERPQVCCDLGFKKMCCFSGTLVGHSVPEYAMVPVPVDVRDDSMFPPGF